MLLDLGHFSLNLPVGWIIRVELEHGRQNVWLIRNGANAKLNLFSAGNDTTGQMSEKIYESLAQDFHSLGTHFDDLAEDCNNEFLVENMSAGSGTSFQHFFVRQISNTVLVAVLQNYEPGDEDSFRNIMDSLELGSLFHEIPALAAMNFDIPLEEWDHLGDSVFIRGVVA